MIRQRRQRLLPSLSPDPVETVGTVPVDEPALRNVPLGLGLEAGRALLGSSGQLLVLGGLLGLLQLFPGGPPPSRQDPSAAKMLPSRWRVCWPFRGKEEPATRELRPPRVLTPPGCDPERGGDQRVPPAAFLHHQRNMISTHEGWHRAGLQKVPSAAGLDNVVARCTRWPVWTAAPPKSNLRRV
jgi:hypothetical protein